MVSAGTVDETGNVGTLSDWEMSALWSELDVLLSPFLTSLRCSSLVLCSLCIYPPGLLQGGLCSTEQC